MSADYIASHGKIAKASGLTIGSFGRLFRRVISVVVVTAYREVIRLTSEIARIISLRSEIG